MKGNLNFEHVELPDPLHKRPPLMSQLNIKVSGGQTLAIVPLDEGTLNPFELLVERFYDPAKGGLVRSDFLKNFYSPVFFFPLFGSKCLHLKLFSF